MKHRINVITAGPSAGKTSTLRELSARGYNTIPEAARILFDQRISEGDNPEEVRKEPDFHEQVERIDKNLEQETKEKKLRGFYNVVFLDRSLADNIAYRKHFGNNSEEKINNLKEECTGRYDKIFLLERIDFEDDEVRDEDEEEAEEIHQTIRCVYEELGYDVVDVPLMTVSERADYIENEIRMTPPIH